jgi:hypothetical protein
MTYVLSQSIYLQGAGIQLLPQSECKVRGKGLEDDADDREQGDDSHSDDSVEDVVDAFVLSDDDSGSNDETMPRRGNVASVDKMKKRTKHKKTKHVKSKYDSKPPKQGLRKLAVKADAKVGKARARPKFRAAKK